jgi:purine nucleoside phosphorylase
MAHEAPCVVPRSEADLPPFDKNATNVVYDRWYGQRLLDRDGRAAAYPPHIMATVANTGGRPGSHVVRA